MMNERKSRKERLYQFIFPELNRALFIRIAVTAAVCTVFFLLFKPCRISGVSMEPTYHDGSVTLSFRWRYLWDVPERGDVVTISYFGRKELLKRVVGLPGDTVEFRNGVLFVNGIEQDEPYVKNPCSWSLKPVKVREGHYFVVGDNRDQRIEEHINGEVLRSRISGGVLF